MRIEIKNMSNIFNTPSQRNNYLVMIKHALIKLLVRVRGQRLRQDISDHLGRRLPIDSHDTLGPAFS